MATGQLAPTEKVSSAGTVRHRSQSGKELLDAKQVPIQIMVPQSVRRQVAVVSAQRGESIRTFVLRALREIGITVPDSLLVDRRGRRRQRGGNSNGQI
jgi:hypothetical protein